MTINEFSLGKRVASGIRNAAKPSFELAKKLSEQSRSKMSIALTEMVEIIKMLNAMDPEKREKAVKELANEAQRIRQSIQQTESIN